MFQLFSAQLELTIEKRESTHTHTQEGREVNLGVVFQLFHRSIFSIDQTHKSIVLTAKQHGGGAMLLALTHTHARA